MSESSWATLVAAHERVEAQLVVEAGRPGQPPKHEPKAAILACSDARVPPSVLFDQPAGNLFVIRIAGNTAVPSALASLDYAVAALGVDLIIVLGHTNCGAVTAAAGGTCQGHLEPIVAPICEIARLHPGVEIDDIAALNVANTMATLSAHNGPVGHTAACGQLEIRGAIHDLTTGRLVPVTTTNQPLKPVEAL
jgi:carbonic anhydrase